MMNPLLEELTHIIQPDYGLMTALFKSEDELITERDFSRLTDNDNRNVYYRVDMLLNAIGQDVKSQCFIAALVSAHQQHVANYITSPEGKCYLVCSRDLPEAEKCDVMMNGVVNQQKYWIF
jgi:hypothetical protein